ncbi:MAG: hypothetical protein AAF368_05745 [Planctomycetota bacterium]
MSSSAQPKLVLSCTKCDERVDATPDQSVAMCPFCQTPHELHAKSMTAEGGLLGCVACGHPELYRRKSFPPGLGVLIVVVAAVLAPFTNYLSLLGALFIDAALYLVMPELVCCYVCGAAHKDFNAEPRHPKFDREIEERLLYGERAVMGKPMREGGTAGAPEPEH